MKGEKSVNTVAALLVTIMLFIYASYAKRKKVIKQANLFDKDGKLTNEAIVSIQKSMRKNNTLS